MKNCFLQHNTGHQLSGMPLTPSTHVQSHSCAVLLKFLQSTELCSEVHEECRARKHLRAARTKAVATKHYYFQGYLGR